MPKQEFDATLETLHGAGTSTFFVPPFRMLAGKIPAK